MDFIVSIQQETGTLLSFAILYAFTYGFNNKVSHLCNANQGSLLTILGNNNAYQSFYSLEQESSH